LRGIPEIVEVSMPSSRRRARLELLLPNLFGVAGANLHEFIM